MLSYHNNHAIKEKYLARVQQHALADEIIKGQYWEGGKGCAVGCTIHSSEHAAYESELGLPTWLARLEDALFEGCPNEYSKTFPERFLEAINVGSDLTTVCFKFAAYLMQQNIETQQTNLALVRQMEIGDDLKNQVVAVIEQAIAANQQVKEINEAAIVFRSFDESAAWSAARSAAGSAAWSAARSARSAAGSAMSAAMSAAWSAKSAESAVCKKIYKFFDRQLKKLEPYVK
jgi:hypothetical protein